MTAVTNGHYRHWLATDVARWMTTGRTTKRKRRDGSREVEVTKVLGPAYVNGWLRILTGELLVRRSHSRRQKIMNRTKQKVDGSITLPLAVLDILREHVATLKGKAAESDLLFPSAVGGYRTRTGLTKPFAAIVEALKLPFKLTPKGMRRTFNDVAREAGTHDVVTRSISGHQTEEMQRHYSTARGSEQRAALEKTLAVTTGKSGNESGKRGIDVG